MKNETKFLVITNPFMIPLEVGLLIAVVLKNLFGGVYKDCNKILNKL